MAVRTGTGGSVAIADTSGASIVAMVIQRWTADFPREMADTTPFQPTVATVATNLRTSVGGNMEISGTFEGLLDDTADFDAADLVGATAEFTAAVTITLEYNRTAASGVGTIQEVTFSGWLTRCAVGVRVGEPNSIAGSFVGTGAPTWQKNQA